MTEAAGRGEQLFDIEWSVVRRGSGGGLLRGRRHRVITGAALASSERAPRSRLATTEVWMRSYTDAEIEEYVASGDPFDNSLGFRFPFPADDLRFSYANDVQHHLTHLLQAQAHMPPTELIEVAGFTDSTGGLQKNKILSQHRADAVIQYLVENHQIPLRRQGTAKPEPAQAPGQPPRRDKKD